MTAPEVGQQVPEEAKLPLRSSTDIQGNILAPFNKPHQAFVFLNFKNNQAGARGWLAELTEEDGRIATTEAVARYNDKYKERKERREPQESKVWMNVGLTCSGLLTLHPELAPDLAVYEAFWQGPLGERRDDKGQVTTTAALLGDEGRGDPNDWVIGGPHQPPVDAIVTIAGDSEGDLWGENGTVLEEQEFAGRFGLEVVPVEGPKGPSSLEQRGDRLEDGKDHFGFKENVSQPGILGFTEEDPDDSGQDRRHPNSPIIAAGEFLLGHRGEQRRQLRPRPSPTPRWMRDGSFQVFRRLTQDVGRWSEVMQGLAGSVRAVKGSKEKLKAMVIGRWPSGAPVQLTPDRDDANYATPKKINKFDYDGDDEGFKTPCFAHIRKMNPRDDALFRDRSHRILRRGIPFGPRYEPDKVDAEHKDVERGLLFNAYVASIEDQFEFLQIHWASDPDVPSSYRKQDPARDGPDPLIGNSTAPCVVRSKRTEEAAQEAQPKEAIQEEPVEFLTWNEAGDPRKPGDFRPFVHTTGAVYAFAPTISALSSLARPEPMQDV
jgi:Dyp-type peroxidase family